MVHTPFLCPCRAACRRHLQWRYFLTLQGHRDTPLTRIQRNLSLKLPSERKKRRRRSRRRSRSRRKEEEEEEEEEEGKEQGGRGGTEEEEMEDEK